PPAAGSPPAAPSPAPSCPGCIRCSSCSPRSTVPVSMSTPAGSDMDTRAIPDGFERLDRMGRFLDHFGPVYTKRVGDAVVVGVRVEEKHLNVRGLAHGGMLVSLADSAIGINLSRFADPPRPMVTVNLSSDFLAPARLGDWIEAHVTVQKRGARLA